MGIEAGTANHNVIDLTEFAAKQGEAVQIAGGLAVRSGVMVKLRANELGQGFYFGGSYFTDDDAINKARMTDTENPLPPYHQAMYAKYYSRVEQNRLEWAIDQAALAEGLAVEGEGE